MKNLSRPALSTSTLGTLNATVSYGSKRQHCIAMSSTEAEIMAASQAALEVCYARGLLAEMGMPLDGPTVLYVDKGYHAMGMAVASEQGF